MYCYSGCTATADLESAVLNDGIQKTRFITRVKIRLNFENFEKPPYSSTFFCNWMLFCRKILKQTFLTRKTNFFQAKKFFYELMSQCSPGAHAGHPLARISSRPASAYKSPFNRHRSPSFGSLEQKLAPSAETSRFIIITRKIHWNIYK